MIHFLIKKNDMIGLDELAQAIQQLEITMNESDYHKLFSHYQKNWNQPKIDWREFAENLRSDLTEARNESIRAAYQKLDPESISKVTLDDIARTYNVCGARDVAQGQRTEEQHYNTFMGLWGNLSAEQ
jgi:Ca2+-binding EF-hand superfamily protein